MNPKREVEIKLWDWLMNRSKSVSNVYFNSKNEVMAPVFSIRGACRKKPDLIIEFENSYTHKNEFMVVEVKDASNSGNVRKGAKVFREYLLNYISGKTKYFINNEEIKIQHFSIATQFSEEGHLKQNEKAEFHESLRGNLSIGNKIVPYYEFTGTCEIYRSMVVVFSDYRKDNILSKIPLPSIGILISDVLLKFDIEEIRNQKGMKGMPIYQAVTFNERKKRWSQCLMKI